MLQVVTRIRQSPSNPREYVPTDFSVAKGRVLEPPLSLALPPVAQVWPVYPLGRPLLMH